MTPEHPEHPVQQASDRRGLNFPLTLPVISGYARTRGWRFVLAWAHRIAGLILIAYLLFHLYILSFLSEPTRFAALWVTHDHIIFRFLAWLLAIPLILHTLNGARLILYESFGWRDDRQMFLWGLIFGCAYLFLMAFFLATGDHMTVSPLFYWLTVFTVSAIFCAFPFLKIWNTPNAPLWKLQRITAAFLFIMIPAHLLYMHTGYAVGHQVSLIASRMRHLPTMLLDAILVIFVLYHAAYGIYAFLGDFTRSRVLRGSLALILVLLAIFLGYIGLKISFHLA